MTGQENQLNEMYKDIILDHYRSPRGRKEVENPDVENEGYNPSCGDEVEMQIKMNGDKIEKLGIHCTGCAISVASGSMLGEIVEGRSIEEVKKIAVAVKSLLTDGELPKEIDLDELGDIEVLEGVKQFPVRIKCALLAWVTLVDSLKNIEKGNKEKGVVSTE